MLASGISRADIKAWWCASASGVAACRPEMPLPDVEAAARRVLQSLLFLRLAARFGLPGLEDLTDSLAGGKPLSMERLSERLSDHFGAALWHADADCPAWNRMNVMPEAVAAVWGMLCRNEHLRLASELPDDLLGQVHQYLLGHRLVRRGNRLCAASNAAARKQAGVFYTPQCVTRYIVENSIGRRLDEPTAAEPSQAELRILDPACGCGAFLLEAFRRLSAARQQSPAKAGLPTAWLHGIDLDPEAVVICRRSLWLQCVRTASLETAASASEHLARNIRCGDVLADAPLSPADGLFDVVLGNPPYRRELNTKHLLEQVVQTDLGRRYRSPRMDYWYYFLHRGLELLRPGGRLAFIVGSYWTSGHGAHKLIRQLRETARLEEVFLLENTPVFEGVAGRHMILTVRKETVPRPTQVKRPANGGVASIEALLGDPVELPIERGGGATGVSSVVSPALAGRQWHPGDKECKGLDSPVEVFEKTPEQLFRAGRIDLEPPADELLAKIARGTPLDQLGKVRQGIAENPASINRSTNARFGDRWTVGEGVFALAPHELAQLELSEAERRMVRPYCDLGDLGRYYLAEQPSRALIYSTDETWPELEQHPRLAAHLARFRPIMESRRETQRGLRCWWQLHWPRDEALWEADKILSLQMGSRPAFVPAAGPVYVPFSVNVFVPAADVREHLHYFAAILNSRLAWTWYRHHAKRRGAGLEINVRVLAQTPIRRINFQNDADSHSHARLVSLVAELFQGQRQLRKADGTRADALQEQLGSIDAEIDQLVCRLYGLEPSEIELVQDRTSGRNGD
jgi:adenine-specific DNA-methyltransferase